MIACSQESAAVRREEAAVWFARMRGPHADRHEQEFTAWIQADDRHRTAYGDAAEIFNLGGKIAADVINAGPRSQSQPRRRVPIPAALILLMLIATASLVPFARRLQPPARVSGGAGPKIAQTLLWANDRQRSIGLADGSMVTLDAGSRLSVLLSRGSRSLRLLRGRVRFDVAHGDRPFTVQSGAGTTTALGTVFDVALEPGNVAAIHLLRGAVDVGRQGQHRRLTGGEAVRVSPAERITAPGKFSVETTQWVTMRLDCEGVPLAAILTEANRHSIVHIVAGEADVARLRVSGAFEITDPRQLARDLAIVLDLHVEQTSRQTLALRHRPRK